MANKQLRQQVLNNRIAKPILLAIEKRLRARIQFERFEGTSEWDPNENVIRVGAGSWTEVFRLFNGGDWEQRLLFHELGHAFLDTFKTKIDRKAFREIFNGPPTKYSAEAADVIIGALKGNVSVTRYGRSHPEEAFAEAFSYAVCNVEDSDLDEDQIRQLAYVDWMIECIKKRKSYWGRYRDYSCEIDCEECGDTIVLTPCRLDLDITGWEFDCPHCGEELVGTGRP
jgi:hypothetical protein